jgi:hypothetical protein
MTHRQVIAQVLHVTLIGGNSLPLGARRTGRGGSEFLAKKRDPCVDLAGNHP